jgi:MFS family permease
MYPSQSEEIAAESFAAATLAEHATPTTATQARATQRRWLLAFGLYTVATNTTFSQAVWVLYLAARGYNPFAIGLFETCFHVAKFVAEIPTGIFADLVGRRASLIVSCAIGAFASLLYLFPSPPALALSFALQGLAFAFRGGADSALLWTLAERSGAPEQSAWYSRVFSRMFVLTLFASTIGTASGGFLAGVNVVLPFLASGVVVALGIPSLLLLPEPKREGARVRRPRPLAHLRAGAGAVWADPVLLGLLALSGLTSGVLTTTGYYSQLYFNGLGFPIAAVGIIVAATVVPAASFAALAPRILRRLSRRAVLAVFVAFEAAGLLGLASGQRLLALAGFVVLLQVGDAVLYPAISTYLNERSPEAQRATVLSLETGLFSAIMIVIFPLFGLGLTRISYGTAYLWTFAALVVGTALIVGGVTMLRRRAARSTTLGVSAKLQ